MLDWLSKLFGRQQDAPPQRCAIPHIRVAHDERVVSVRDDKGRVALINWEDVMAVKVIVTRTGPDPEVSWLLAHRDGRGALGVPMGANGEPAFVKAMQARYSGFDNMAVVEALSSPVPGEFQIWPPLDIA